jgi:hypothetical protein
MKNVSLRSNLTSFSSVMRMALIPLFAAAITTSQAALIARWSFNEPSGTVVSNSAGPVNGSIVGSVSRITGQVGQAFQFNGNGYVTFGNSIGNFGTNDFSVACWMKISANQLFAFVDKRPACNMNSGSGWWDIRGFVGGGTAFGFYVSSPSLQDFNLVYTTAPLHDGAWHHVVWERQGVTVRVFVDGVLNGAGTATTIANVNSTAELKFGNSSCTGADGTTPYSGAIDELELYNHALSSNEISVLYSSTSTPTTNTVSDCATNLAFTQLQLAAATQTNATLLTRITTLEHDIAVLEATNSALEGALLVANTKVFNLQNQLTATTSAYTNLQAHLGTVNNLNGYYTNLLCKIAKPVNGLSTNFATKYSSPGFKVPGATLDAQVSNIVLTIRSLENGQQLKIFRNWSLLQYTNVFRF